MKFSTQLIKNPLSGEALWWLLVLCKWDAKQMMWTTNIKSISI